MSGKSENGTVSAFSSTNRIMELTHNRSLLFHGNSVSLNDQTPNTEQNVSCLSSAVGKYFSPAAVAENRAQTGLPQSKDNFRTQLEETSQRTESDTSYTGLLEATMKRSESGLSNRNCIPHKSTLTDTGLQLKCANLDSDIPSEVSPHLSRSQKLNVDTKKTNCSDLDSPQAGKGNILRVRTEKKTTSAPCTTNEIMTNVGHSFTRPGHVQLLGIPQISNKDDGSKSGTGLNICSKGNSVISDRHTMYSASVHVPLKQTQCIQPMTGGASEDIFQRSSQFCHISDLTKNIYVASEPRRGISDFDTPVSTRLSTQQIPSDSTNYGRSGVHPHRQLCWSDTLSWAMKRINKRNEARTNTGERRGNIGINETLSSPSRPPLTVTYTSEVSISTSSTKHHTGEAVYQPPLSVQLLSDFNSRESDDDPLTCEVCEKKFSSVKHLQDHFGTHMDVWTAMCKLCDKRFTNKEHLDSHMQSHSAGKHYECNICHDTFNSRNTLQKHIRKIHGAGQRRCKECNKRYDAGDYESHARQYHGEDVDKSKPHRCHVCDRRFSKLCLLTDHMPTHSDERAFLCSICGKTWKTKHSLKNHIRRHAQEHVRVTCKVCGKKVTDLYLHMKTHNAEKKHLCEKCGRAFLLKHHLNTHMKSHLDERPYVCDICGNSFKLPHRLREHKKIHGKKLFHVKDL